MGVPIVVVDAFASRAYEGNPAAVCVLRSPQEAEWMQRVAMEMNLSETAFLSPREDGFDLRWFTPKVEVDLCGHATLASAHVLWETRRLNCGERARFHTKSGPLGAGLKGEWIEMDFPAKPEEPCEAPPLLLDSLGVKARYVGRNKFDYLVEVDSEETVRALAPDFQRLGKVPVRGVMVTARASSKEFDFVSRFFAPSSGVNEDPVTGSAHCCLAPFWGKKLGKQAMVGRQVSSRGGTVRVRVEGERVILAGQAVTTLRGELAGEFDPTDDRL